MTTSRYDIAQHWAEADATGAQRADATFGHTLDLDEPACFACDYSCHTWKVPAEWSARWAKADGLERAHVLAASDGGSVEPGNLVLLCRSCHAAAPMLADSAWLFAWMRRRENHLARAVRELRGELSALGVDLEQLSPTGQAMAFGLFSIGASRKETVASIKATAARLGAGRHFGVGTSPATQAAVFCELLRGAGAVPA